MLVIYHTSVVISSFLLHLFSQIYFCGDHDSITAGWETVYATTVVLEILTFSNRG